MPRQMVLSTVGVVAVAMAIVSGIGIAGAGARHTGASVTPVITYGAGGGIPGSNYRVVFGPVAGKSYGAVILHEGYAYKNGSKPQTLIPQLEASVTPALRKLAVSESFYSLPKMMNCPQEGVGASTEYISIAGNGSYRARTVKLSNVKGSGACHAGEFNQLLSVLVAIANFPESPRHTPK